MSLQALTGTAGSEEVQAALEKREAFVFHALTAPGQQLG